MFAYVGRNKTIKDLKDRDEVRLLPALTVRPNRSIRKVGMFNTWYKYGRIDGQTLGIPGSGKVNMRSENGPFGPTVRVGVIKLAMQLLL